MDLGGCNLGEQCDYVHPSLCSSSVKNKTCSHIGSDKKCPKGYHIKGTRSPPSGDNVNNKKSNTKTKNSTKQDVPSGVMDFLGALVKISKAIDKAQEKPPDLKTLLMSLA